MNTYFSVLSLSCFRSCFRDLSQLLSFLTIKLDDLLDDFSIREGFSKKIPRTVRFRSISTQYTILTLLFEKSLLYVLLHENLFLCIVIPVVSIIIQEFGHRYRTGTELSSLARPLTKQRVKRHNVFRFRCGCPKRSTRSAALNGQTSYHQKASCLFTARLQTLQELMKICARLL